MIKWLSKSLTNLSVAFSGSRQDGRRTLRVSDDGSAVMLPGEARSLFSKRYRSRLLEIFDFSLAFNAWKSSRQVVGIIVLATFLINLVSLAFPLTLLQVYDRIIPNQAVATLVLLIVGVGTALILEVILRVCRSYVGAWADAKFEHIVGTQAFKKLIDTPLDLYERVGVGVHLKRLNAISNLKDFYAGQAIISLVDLPFVIILLALIAYIGSFLVFVPIVMLIAFFVLTAFQVEPLQHVLKQRQEHDNRRMNFIIETLSNIHTIKAVTMEAQMLRRYERLQKTAAINDHSISLKGAHAGSQGILLSQATIILVAAFGSMMVVQGSLTIGALAACTLLSGRCLQPITAVIALWNRVQSIKVAREELNHILALPTEAPPHLAELESAKGSLEFRNVSFSYHGQSDELIKNFNLKINAGETVAIKGDGLSGKSSVLWLALGVLKPTSGKVLIDGKDCSQLQPESIQRIMGYLPQEGVLFKGTIADNLTMFQEEYFDSAMEAAKRIGLADVVEQLPDGFDTQLGDKAVESLPRGIKQRITIARALVHKPKIILFDEANTGIDMQGDRILNELLKELSGECTIILVSHRPSTLALAKRQYALEKGRLRLIL